MGLCGTNACLAEVDTTYGFGVTRFHFVLGSNSRNSFLLHESRGDRSYCEGNGSVHPNGVQRRTWRKIKVCLCMVEL